jgi:hypothetical protein
MATKASRNVEGEWAASWAALQKALGAPRPAARRASAAPAGFIPLTVRTAPPEAAAVVRVGEVGVALRELDAASAEWVARLVRACGGAR